MNKKLIICSGAGLSQESGIETFRDSGGLWDQYKVDEICNIDKFLENYIAVNEFYDLRRQQLKAVEPNYAHKKIAELSKHFNVINITCNVDDLLERSGSKNVIHLHGKITEVIKNHEEVNEEIIDIGYEKSPFEDPNNYPLKPNVVFFGERAPEYRTFDKIISEVTSEDIIIVVGSSELVVDFSQSFRVFNKKNAKILFVNPDDKFQNIDKVFTNLEFFQMKSCDFFKSYDFDSLL